MRGYPLLKRCAGYSSQLSTFTAESRVTCLPYQPAVTGAVARIDMHALALPIKNRRGADCVAILDIKNRLELSSHVVDTVRCLQSCCSLCS
jgi:hypothetical protein